MIATTAERSSGAVLASSVRRRIVAHLAEVPGETPERPGRSAAELAAYLRLHVTTVRFHLDQLVRSGHLQTSWERLPRAGRPRKLYAAATPPDQLPDADAHFQVLAELLALNWPGPDSPGSTPEEAGRRWALEHADPRTAGSEPASTPGRWLSKVGDMVDLLEQWGYTPELQTSKGGRTVTVHLDGCPFLALARIRPDVVCAVHRGLITGALEHAGEPAPRIELQPFVSPTQCLARVTTAATFASLPSTEGALA